jgi:hypothetical protein
MSVIESVDRWMDTHTQLADRVPTNPKNNSIRGSILCKSNMLLEIELIIILKITAL